MLQFVKYNFLEDKNAIDPYPVVINKVNNVQIQNAIFDELVMSENIDATFSTNIPSDWDIYTLLLATFDNTLNAGSVDYSVSELDKIRIKRRPVGDYNWITIYEHIVETPADLGFSYVDYFAANDTEYEYAWVPVLGNREGNYITKTILSKFNGVFIADANNIFKMWAGVSYGPTQQIQLVGVFNPIGQKYPIYVSNAETNYQSGSVMGKIIADYSGMDKFNRKQVVQYKNAFIKFLTNKKAKVLKDSNGNIWLCFITNEPSVSYDAQYGNGMMEISYQWGEIGDIEDAEIMQNVGLRPTVY